MQHDSLMPKAAGQALPAPHSAPDDIEDTDTEDNDAEELAESPATEANQEGQALPATKRGTTQTRNKSTSATSLECDSVSPTVAGQALPAQRELLLVLQARRKQKRNDLFWLLILLPFL